MSGSVYEDTLFYGIVEVRPSASNMRIRYVSDQCDTLLMAFTIDARIKGANEKVDEGYMPGIDFGDSEEFDFEGSLTMTVGAEFDFDKMKWIDDEHYISVHENLEICVTSLPGNPKIKLDGEEEARKFINHYVVGHKDNWVKAPDGQDQEFAVPDIIMDDRVYTYQDTY